MSTNKRQEGFTLVEMLVVAPIVILAVGAFLTILVTMTGEVLASRAANTLAYNTQDALRQIEQDVKQSAGFLATNNIGLNTGGAGAETTTNSRQGYNSDATAFTNVGANGPMLILNMIATTQNPNSIDSRYVYLKDQPNACNNSPDQNTPLSYNVVYFVKDNTLWRRSVMPTQYNDSNYSCATPWQQPSCAPSYMYNKTGVFCKTEDTRLVEGVTTSDFVLEYFTGSNNTTPNAVAASVGAAVESRQSALQSVTTLKTTITAKQNAGGREVSQSASIRASRLDGNASAIATPTATTTPIAPSVTVQAQTGAKVAINWAAIPGATNYTLQYQVDGGSWNTVFANENTRTATIDNLYNDAVVVARATATNGAGTSSYGTGTTTIPMWEPLIMQNNWVSFGSSYALPSYAKTKSGIIILKGLIKRSGTPVSGQSVAKLPYWPSTTIAQPTFSDLQAARVTVYGAENAAQQGEIALSGNISNNWTSLDTIRFVPTSSGLVQTTVVPFNGWGQTSSPLKYAVDGSGRVAVQGTLTPGDTSTSSRFAILPVELNPSRRTLAPVIGGTNFGSIAIDYRAGSYTLQPRQTPASSPDIGINALYYPDSYAGWTEATMLNGWVNYGVTQTSAGYTKSANDGVVSLKGTIKSGTTAANTPIFTLPVGSRPKELLNFIVVSDMTFGSVEISTDGNVRFRNGTNVAFSLDGISFKAEQ